MLTLEEINHYQFFQRTDRRSLFNQIKSLVKSAQEVASKEIEQRRGLLQHKLEHEHEIYQQEFANTVKSRVDKDIKNRNEALLKIKEERHRLEQEFLEKQIQRKLEDCYEIREALKRKERLEVKVSQLEHITEKERAFMRNRRLDDYWCKMRDANIQHYDQQLAFENKLKRDMQHTTRIILDEQVEVHKREHEVDRELKRQEANEIDKIRQEMQLEQHKNMQLSPEKLAYRKELLDAIAEKKEQRDAEAFERAEEHRALMRQVTKEGEAESAALLQRKRAVYRATMEYISYAREMHKLEQESQEMRNARIDDLSHVDICTNESRKRELKHRAEMASLYYAELRRQSCEEYERRLREAEELREQKIMENRFARPDKTMVEIAAERRKVREELERQVAENERLRAEEETKYNMELQYVSDDRDFCKQLAENYIRERKEYLPAHPNWRIYSCPKKEYVDKTSEYERKVDGADTCSTPCGCNARTDYDCTQHSYMSKLKRGLDAEGKLQQMKIC